MTAARDESFALYDELAAADPDFKTLLDSWNAYREGCAEVVRHRRGVDHQLRRHLDRLEMQWRHPAPGHVPASQVTVGENSITMTSATSCRPHERQRAAVDVDGLAPRPA